MFERWRRQPGKKGSESTKLLVGLGNPGSEYAGTRHNVGFMTIAKMAEELKIKANRSAHQALIGEGRLGGYRLVLAQPQTYMNRSGIAVAALVKAYGLAPEDLLVVCDDLDLELGRLRLRAKGGDGGHRGLRSIIACLGTKEFPRLRIGVGRPASKEETVDYVLTGFNREEQILVNEAVEAAAAGVRQWLFEGVNRAMNRVNVWKPASLVPFLEKSHREMIEDG